MEKRKTGVSPELDELSGGLLGEALDMLADGGEFGVLVAVEDGDEEVETLDFSDDGPEECLDAAREYVRDCPDAVRYALCYVGAVAGKAGAYEDALIFEFGERGYEHFSGYMLFAGRGEGDAFAWTSPAPAGGVEPLL